MADLIAQGKNSTDRWRRTLSTDQTLVLGRVGDWSVSWDGSISRQHAELRFSKGKLLVRCLPHARNPVFQRGDAADLFEISVGEHFVIGGTTFTLSNARANVSMEMPPPAMEETFHIEDLKKLRFRDADQRITLLSRLAELVTTSRTDRDLFSSMANLLLAGISRATAVAFVSVRRQDTSTDLLKKSGTKEATDDTASGAVASKGAASKGAAAEGSSCPISILHWDRRRVTSRDFQPSERLIREALGSRTAVLHLWKSAASPQFTATEEADWAFCTPLPNETTQRMAIYVSGRFTTEIDETSDLDDASPGNDNPDDESFDNKNPGNKKQSGDLRDDLKFAEVVAASLSSALENRQLLHRQAGLRQFFAPVVLSALANEDPDTVLAPRETDVSVLFCDLRGFARRSEQQADDLLGLLDRVSQALGVATRHILDSGGVVGDLQGDAAMGFWGWPLAQENSAALAARAALAIRAEFQRDAAVKDHALAGFQAGIGLATGRAVAGKIGTEEVVKVTVFGPVVNLASRLEGMTKILQAPILMDAPTTAQVRDQLNADTARVRRLAVVRPYGLEKPVEVSELLPPESEHSRLSDDHIRDYESALSALIRGDWDEAFELLHRVPSDDRAKDFLTVLIAQHNRTAPSNWDGVIPLGRKN